MQKPRFRPEDVDAYFEWEKTRLKGTMQNKRLRQLDADGDFFTPKA